MTPDAAIEQLCLQDPGVGADAEVALASLTFGEGLENLTQHAVQGWLWYTLPEKFWIDDSHKLRLAKALAQLLVLVGLPRYAALCTSTQTVEVLEAYERGHAQGREAFRRAVADSGVEPTDVPELSWGAVMGIDELSAFNATADALELPIEDEEFQPGTRGWRQGQVFVIRAFLLRSRPELDGQCWLDRVLSERVEGWAASRGQQRASLLDLLLPHVLAAKPEPAPMQNMAPVTWLLERAVQGVPLTATHRLKPSIVVELAETFGWNDAIGTRRQEEDVFEVRELRDLVEGIGAVRRSGQRLALTPLGRRLLARDADLWCAICGYLVSGWPFTTKARETALLVMLRDDVDGGDEVAARVSAVLADEGWRDPVSGQGPGAREVRWELMDIKRVLDILNLVDRDPGRRWRATSWRLNDDGRAAALLSLNIRATRARSSVKDMA